MIEEIDEVQLDLEGNEVWDEKPMIDIYERYNVKEMLDSIRIKDSSRPHQHRLKKFIPQDYSPWSWSQYEQACQREKMMFFKILRNAVAHLGIEPEYKGTGRPPANYADIVKSLCIRLYSNYSSWRAESELKIAKSMGIIDRVYKRSTLNKYLQDEAVTNTLHDIIKIIAEPLTDVEKYFAIDASGISNLFSNKKWSQVRHTKEEAKERGKYSKLHIMTGVQTNVITVAGITKGTANDSPYLKELVEEAAETFNIQEVSADAGYLSKKNVKAISNIGALPFIKGKKNVNIPKRGPPTPWGQMLYFWYYHQPEFAEHYNRRSNVESTFAMLKRKFGDSCRAKLFQSRKNEVLCKIVCHNAAVLSQALLEFDLSKGFIATL